jgi:hypothetical protein
MFHSCFIHVSFCSSSVHIRVLYLGYQQVSGGKKDEYGMERDKEK